MQKFQPSFEGSSSEAALNYYTYTNSILYCLEEKDLKDALWISGNGNSQFTNAKTLSFSVNPTAVSNTSTWL